MSAATSLSYKNQSESQDLKSEINPTVGDLSHEYAEAATATDTGDSDFTHYVLVSCKKKDFKRTCTFEKLSYYLKTNHECKVEWNEEEINDEATNGKTILVFLGPAVLFTLDEIECMRAYLEKGGSMLVLLTEPEDDQKNQSNINYFLEEYGIVGNEDCVIRLAHTRPYNHPKMALISDGFVCAELKSNVKAASTPKLVSSTADDPFIAHELQTGATDFIYVHGSTLTVAAPAIPILSSGSLSFPMSSAIGAVYKTSNDGRLVVIGSTLMFNDEHIEKEANKSLAHAITNWLLRIEGSNLTSLPHTDIELQHNHIPDTITFANEPKSSFQDIVTPVDQVTDLIHLDYKHRNDLTNIPAVIGMYKDLGLKYEPLELIPPDIEVPLPPVRAEVFPPVLPELEGPPLEFFDLDEEIADATDRLVRLTCKFFASTEDKVVSDTDLAAYIVQASKIAGLEDTMNSVGNIHEDAQEVLNVVCAHLMEWKMFPSGLSQT